MKKIINIGLLLMLGIWMSGCSKSYERDTTPGEIVNITLLEMEEKIKNNEDFAVMLTTTTCSYCLEFKAMLEPYLQTHHFTMYNVILDKEQRSQEDNLDIIYRYFEDFSTTPGIYYVKNGKMKSHLRENKNGIDEELLDRWVVKNELDAKVEE